MQTSTNHQNGQAQTPETDPGARAYEQPYWERDLRAFEGGFGALCELGEALASLRFLSHQHLNDILESDRAAIHCKAIEAAIIDLAIGVGIQRKCMFVEIEHQDRESHEARLAARAPSSHRTARPSHAQSDAGNPSPTSTA